MAQQGGGFGKIVLWVVLGIVGIVVAGNVIWWLVGNLLVPILVVAAVAGVAVVAFRMGRRSVSGGGDRRQLPR